jgi:hypothetical protein
MNKEWLILKKYRNGSWGSTKGFLLKGDGKHDMSRDRKHVLMLRAGNHVAATHEFISFSSPLGSLSDGSPKEISEICPFSWRCMALLLGTLNETKIRHL